MEEKKDAELKIIMNEGQSFFTFDRLMMDNVYRELCASQDERCSM